MKLLAVAAASLLASTVLAVPANATVLFAFAPGVPSPSAGYTVVDTFTTAAGLTGSNYIIKTGSSSTGAEPAQSSTGNPYLSVLGGGSATYTFDPSLGPVTSFQFDWGSIDGYNTLSYTGTTSGSVVPGTSTFPNAANGNQFLPGTNGRFTVYGDAGETFTSVTFASRSNSFEVDNLAVGSVPEPATWAVMLLGFGLRNRRNQAVRVTYA